MTCTFDFDFYTAALQCILAPASSSSVERGGVRLERKTTKRRTKRMTKRRTNRRTKRRTKRSAKRSPEWAERQRQLPPAV